ncbi:hypothetical protein ES702_07405 [subsurface metagenome]
MKKVIEPHARQFTWLEFPVQDIKPGKLPATPEIIIWIQHYFTSGIQAGLVTVYAVKSPEHYFHITKILMSPTQTPPVNVSLQFYSGTEIMTPTFPALARGDVEDLASERIPLIAKSPGDNLVVNILPTSPAPQNIELLIIGWESPIRYHSSFPIRG